MGKTALDELYHEVEVLLVTRTFRKRTYFADGQLRISHRDFDEFDNMDLVDEDMEMESEDAKET